MPKGEVSARLRVEEKEGDWRTDVPSVQEAVPSGDVLAICVADIHLSHNPPAGRQAELSWYNAMDRYLWQLRELKLKHKCPILCAGDLFNTWKEPAELINFALDNLPEMLTIPGQHDLPFHVYKDVHKSPYWTLVASGRTKHMEEGGVYYTPGLRIMGFPWESKPRTWTHDKDGRLKVAVIHGYVWKKGEGEHPAAKIEDHVNSRMKQFKGFDILIFGDNHMQFVYDKKPFVFNCGCLIPRRQDERFQVPRVGLIKKNGTVEGHYLDNSEDKWSETTSEEAAAVAPDKYQKFIEDVKGLREKGVDFKARLRHAAQQPDIPAGVKQFVLECMEG